MQGKSQILDLKTLINLEEQKLPTLTLQSRPKHYWRITGLMTGPSALSRIMDTVPQQPRLGRTRFGKLEIEAV